MILRFLAGAVGRLLTPLPTEGGESGGRAGLKKGLRLLEAETSPQFHVETESWKHEM